MLRQMRSRDLGIVFQLSVQYTYTFFRLFKEDAPTPVLTGLQSKLKKSPKNSRFL
jgi:hypothetical protein